MNKTVVALAILYVLTLIAFAGLYLFTPPREVVREIIRDATPAPVERIVQPVEKMVQDTLRPLMPTSAAPAEKPVFQWQDAPLVSSEIDILRAMGPVRLNVSVNEVLSKILSAGAAQDPILAALSRRNIPVSPDAGTTLNISIQGLWDDGQQVLTYRVSISITETTIMLRNESPFRVPADVWQRGSYGFAGKLVARDTVITEAVRLTDIFSENYLNANPPTPVPQ
jgi:hypothetical protein